MSFLGFDLSTQQIKAIILDHASNVLHHTAVHFDTDLPFYQTANGALHGPDDGEVSSPVLMWLDAIDLLLLRMKRAGVDLAVVAAIAGAGQVSPSRPAPSVSAISPPTSNTAPSTGPTPQSPHWPAWTQHVPS